MKTNTSAAKQSIQPGKKYRFVVNSAEEAVRTIQENMGPDARVLSVNQVGGEGLSRFLQSPRLEIIATVPVAEKPKDQAVEQKDFSAAQEQDVVVKPAAVSSARKTRMDYFAKDEASPNLPPLALRSILLRMGFSGRFLARFESLPSWESLQSQPLGQALQGFRKLVEMDAMTVARHAVGNRVVFLGPPGHGKTTALCKRLAQDVFLQGRRPSVFKWETEDPNSTDALQTFCEILGVTFYRGGDHVPADLQGPFYCDLTGIPLRDERAWDRAKDRCGEWAMDSKIFVLNGAYHPEWLYEGLEFADEWGATHLCLTHLDEVKYAAPLLPLLQFETPSPLMLSDSPSVTDGYHREVAHFLLEKIFSRPTYTE